jgi:PTS system cellobiose-specific IIC component
MDRIVGWMENYLSGPMARFSEQRHLRAIRDGVISALPFIIVGSFFLILAFPPLPKDWAISEWAAKNALQILLPYRLTMYIMSLYIAFGVGYNLAKSYKLDPLSGAQVSVCALLLTLTPELLKDGYALPMSNLGGSGLFVTMIVSIVAVEILRFCKTKNITIKMPEQVPPSVARSFEALIPVAAVIILMSLITYVFKIDLHSEIGKLIAPIVTAGDSIWGVLIPGFLICFLWFFGIHGDSVVGPVVRPLWELYLAKNAEAVANHSHHLPHVAPETFFQWFIWIGGSGATLGLVLAMLVFSKSKYMKAVGRASIIPSIFNINEPVIFGVPIVLNPILAIPFILTPIINICLTYFLTVVGWVTPTFVQPPWTLPAPIGAYLATGGDIHAVFLTLINIAISFFVYLPFFKMYDRKMAKMETDENDNQAA